MYNWHIKFYNFVFDSFCLHMAKKSATEVFEHYYHAIVSTLPMKNYGFMKNLEANNLLPSHIKDSLETLITITEKAAYFLDNTIKAELSYNIHTCFDKLLTVMMESDCDDMKDLATRIKSELPYADDSKQFTYTGMSRSMCVVQ